MSDITTSCSAIELAELTIEELEQNDPLHKERHLDWIRELRLELRGLEADVIALTHQGKLTEAEELKARVDSVKNRFDKLKNKGMEENI